MRKKNICIDFDGVMNTYTGWKGEEELFEMREGCREFIIKLAEIYNVVVFTTRKAEYVWAWLEKYQIKDFVNDVTDIKIPAEVYLDDRALKFEGNFLQSLDCIKNFKSFWNN